MHTYLIGGITDADIEVWELGFHHISKNDIQAFLVWGRLETLGDFSSHTRVKFHRNTLLCLFQNLGCQVTSTGTDFEDDLLTLLVFWSPFNDRYNPHHSV